MKEYNTYTHKRTGLQVKALPYEKGLEDGFLKNDVPYIIGWDVGLEKKIPINENSIIVFHKKYKFIFDKDWFLKDYEKVEK